MYGKYFTLQAFYFKNFFHIKILICLLPLVQGSFVDLPSYLIYLQIRVYEKKAVDGGSLNDNEYRPVFPVIMNERRFSWKN